MPMVMPITWAYKPSPVLVSTTPAQSADDGDIEGFTARWAPRVAFAQIDDAEFVIVDNGDTLAPLTVTHEAGGVVAASARGIAWPNEAHTVLIKAKNLHGDLNQFLITYVTRDGMGAPAAPAELGQLSPQSAPAALAQLSLLEGRSAPPVIAEFASAPWGFDSVPASLSTFTQMSAFVITELRASFEGFTTYPASFAFIVLFFSSTEIRAELFVREPSNGFADQALAQFHHVRPFARLGAIKALSVGAGIDDLMLAACDLLGRTERLPARSAIDVSAEARSPAVLLAFDKNRAVITRALAALDMGTPIDLRAMIAALEIEGADAQSIEAFIDVMSELLALVRD